jgi:hypothetical protein
MFYCLFLGASHFCVQAQPTNQANVEIAVYHAAIQCVFSESRLLAHSYYVGSKPYHRDFFVLVPKNIKPELSFGKQFDKFVVDSCGLYKRVRKATYPALIIISIQEVPNTVPLQFGVHFGIEALAKISKNQFESRVVPSPLFVKDENYFLGFEVIEEENGNILVERYPVPYMPPKSQ